MLFSSIATRSKQSGFTLIEIIVGIVVLAISLSIVGTLIAPAEEKSADQILQIKAAELAQSLLNDISSRAFDENSDMAGGRIRCGEPNDGSNDCTLEANFGPDTGETTRGLFNDVDDFHDYSEHFNANDESLHVGYGNFIIDVQVSYDGASLGLANNAAKLIAVTVTTPLGTAIEFSTHKANF
ncbi:MAG: type II secretion system GspH family protein [Colwellia sp.]|nr:type II secretion system GspH family protein [Colwellia sp.]MCW8864966.1 type II secretion system GspH family protein [Colwellia sp.]MCW9082154.1 type II secretion system GspH family protein [Colwellia sp.]